MHHRAADRLRNGLRAAVTLLPLLLAPIARPAPSQSPPASETAAAFRREHRALLEALDFLQLHYTIDSGADEITLAFDATSYRNAQGQPTLELLLQPFKFGPQPWYQLRAPAFASLRQCRFPSAARRVLLEAGHKLPSDVQFLSNEVTGSVDAQMAIPVVDDQVHSGLLQSYLLILTSTVDSVWPVLQRASDTGFIDWPRDDEGPKKPQGTLRVDVPGGEPMEVGWATWVEPSAYASTLLAAEKLLRKFTQSDDIAREDMGRRLSGEFDGGFNLSTYAEWMRGAQYAEQHYPPISVRFWGPPGTQVAASIRVPGFAPSTRATQTIDAMGMRDVDLLPNWNRQALAALREPTVATVEFTVECGGKTESGTREITIQPSDVVELDMPLLPVAVMVNEDHPWVKGLISEAKQLGIAPSMGYTGSEDYEDCARQVYAVWKVFRDRGLSYVATQHRDSAAEESANQRIRPLHEAIVERSANCADGAAALASVLLRLGFDVHLICPRNHVFLGVYVRREDDGPCWICIETTGLGDVEVQPDRSTPVVKSESGIPERLRGEDWQTFLNACENAEAQLREEPTMISVRALRERGLQPIPAPSGLGTLPRPMARTELERERESLRETRRRDRAQFEAKLACVKDRPVRPYESLDRIREDVDAIERDPEALIRLLASVDGEQQLAVMARALGWTEEQLLAADRAAAERFGSLPGRALPSVGVSGFPWELDVQPSPKDPEVMRIQVTPKDHETPGSWVAAHRVGESWHMTARSLNSGMDLPMMVVCQCVGAGQDGAAFRAVAEALRTDVEAGTFASANEYMRARTERLSAVIRPAMERQESEGGVSAPTAATTTAAPAKAAETAELAESSTDLKPGSGPRARAGQPVHYHYECHLADGRPVFDSRASGKPRSRKAGDSLLPQGLSDGLVGVRAGMHRRLVLPPDRAYGEKGMPEAGIPPEATLVFDLYIDRIGD